jgi:DNA-binding MarR family transcriptional regulator
MSGRLQFQRQQSARAVAELIQHVSRSLAADIRGQQLNPAQWAALRYLAHANEGARQVGAFAKFHLTTPSSASQTIGSLVSKGLVAKRTTDDGRRWTLNLTNKGRRALEQDPIVKLFDAIMILPEEKVQVLAEAMQQIVQQMAKKR